MSYSIAAAGLFLIALLPNAQAADTLPGLYFAHHDWELTCDNTRTCRAAGYHPDDDELKLSVLLTRKAGAGQAVTGELKFGELDDAELVNKMAPGTKFALQIDQRVVGQSALGKEGAAIPLSADQVQLLLAALRKSSKIEWVQGTHRWRLSDKGVAAVFLKMDEFQGRLGSKGALLKPGALGEEKVLPPVPAPVVLVAAPVKLRPADNQLVAGKATALRDALRASIKGDDDCADMQEDAAGKTPLSVHRLSATKVLVSTACWRAAYNTGDGYWVINDAPPFAPVLVTTSGVDFGNGKISASQKGRGIGDCISFDEWTWDGQKFVHSSSSSTGMCRLIAAGGTWSLPRIVSDLRPAPR